MRDDLFDPRLTEQRNPRTLDIDLASELEIVDSINAEDRLVPEAVLLEREQIAAATKITVDCLQRGGRLIYVGAGTSGRLGILDATECPPTFGTDPQQVRGFIAGGYAALTRSQEGAEDDPEAGAAALDEARVGPDDFVFGIATSGTTPYVRGALERAVELGARTGFLCCTEPGKELRDLVDVCVVPLVGPEVIAGSTRMKAGTATKLVLNTISTGAMIRLGKVYENLMVDLRAISEKLVDRSQRIVMAATGCARAEASDAIERAEGSVKLAIVMHKAGVGRELARLYLLESGGFVRRALQAAEAVEAAASGFENVFAHYPVEPPDDESQKLALYVSRALAHRISSLVTETSDAELRLRPAEGKWCAKEHVEHLIDIDSVMSERLGAILTEDAPRIANRDDEEENRGIVASGAREATIEDLLARLADSRSALMRTMETAPAESFARTGTHAAFGPVSAYQILRHLVWHDDHHVQAVRRLLDP